MREPIYINLDHLLDLLECIQDATEDTKIIDTVDEVINVAFELAKENVNE